VSADTMERFAERFARCGLRPEALFPVFGLAECAVGLAFPPLGRGVLVDSVSTEELRRHGRAQPAEPGRPGTTRFVACGRPIPGHEIRVVDEAGRELGERSEGEVEFKGPSATSGYYRNPEATAALFDDGWLDTGDLGYFAGGDLFITGRTKDIIIKAGRNVHPEELEAAVGGVEGVRKGGVAAFGVPDAGTGTEQLVVVAETQETGDTAKERLRAAIVGATVDALEAPPDEVVLVRPGMVPKTSSGKIRRRAAAELYETGALGKRRRPVWWQVVRFSWSGLGPRLRRHGSTVASTAYAGYCWVIFAAVGGAAVVAVAVLPRLSWRRRAVRAAAGLLLRLSGTSLGVHGADRLPQRGPCVLAANHQSWLDGLVLAGWLPATFSFVAGEVLRDQRVAGYLLSRMGAKFVGSTQPGSAGASTERLTRAAAAGPILIFPEGGVSRAPGLRPFHLGGFVAAAEAQCPLVPLAIRGTRSMLRPGQKFMRRGAVRLYLGEPIAPAGTGWAAAVELERQAREVILRHCGEPDLE
jgi:1-acyl-sn-glycerol-3-phosphate acyltransferase